MCIIVLGAAGGVLVYGRVAHSGQWESHTKLVEAQTNAMNHHHTFGPINTNERTAFRATFS